MANHSWTFDAPTGVYKNHSLSSDIRMASIKEAKFMQFVNPEDGSGRKKGESVTITRVSNVDVPSDDTLTEGVRIPEDTLSLSTQAITIVERGRAIPYSSLSVDLGHFDLANSIQSKLRDQLKLRMDITAAAAFKAGRVVMVPEGIATSTFETAGAPPSATAVVNWNLFHVESIRDYMFETLNVAPMTGDDYVCVIITKGKRGIIRDPNWQEWQKYTDPSKKFNSEIGRMENIRFIETNHTSALSNAKGTGSVLGEGVVFGADAVRMAVAEDPHLMAEENVGNDFGRQKSVAWYGIYGFGQIWSDSSNSGEARSVYVTSA